MKKFISLMICGVCAFTTMAFVGCEKNSSNANESTSSTETTSEIPEVLDILDGRFTAITLDKLQTIAGNIAYTADVVSEEGFEIAKEIVANNEGVDFSAKSMGDDEGEWDGYQCTGKVFNGKGRFFYEGQGGVRGEVVVEETLDIYCDGEIVYELETRGESVEKIKYGGDVNDGLRNLYMEDVPNLKEWTEREGYTYEYYLDETDGEYNKIKMTISQTVERNDDMFYGAHTRERTQTVIFAFDKEYKLKAFSLVEKTTWTYTDKTWVWDTEYIARPWSGEIQAPDNLSEYVEEAE